MKILLITLVLAMFSNAMDLTYDVPDELLGSVSNLTPLADSITDLEKEVLEELNLLRSNPRDYAMTYLLPMVENSTDEYYAYPSGLKVGSDRSVETLTIKEIIQEAMRALISITYRRGLIISEGMSNGANDLIWDQNRVEGLGHTDSYGNMHNVRMSQYGQIHTRSWENISYGLTSPRDIVISFIIDDGVLDRGHRNTVLTEDARRVGVAMGDHPSMNSMCVITYAVGYTEN